MLSRRDFLSAAVGVAALKRAGGGRPPSIEQVINLILGAVPGAPWDDSVDTVKSGDPSQPVRGIATTFLATGQVIQQAIFGGVNLIITHEPTYFNHLDETDWLAEDAVYQAKRKLLEDNGVVVWRFHDYWHAHEPDGIATGVLRLLGWESFAQPGAPHICHIPPRPLSDLTLFLKRHFGAQRVRVMGAPDMACGKIGLLVGAVGGREQIRALRDVDLLVCGEVREWETTEYIRDAHLAGLEKGLIVVGHALSEEPGMSYLAEWLRPRVLGIPVIHLATGDPFRFI